MAYALKLDSGLVPLTGLVDPGFLLEAGRATITYAAEPAIRDHFLNLFSTHHSVSSQTEAMSGFLGGMGSKEAGNLSYDNIFRVLIVRKL